MCIDAHAWRRSSRVYENGGQLCMSIYVCEGGLFASPPWYMIMSYKRLENYLKTYSLSVDHPSKTLPAIGRDFPIKRL